MKKLLEKSTICPSCGCKCEYYHVIVPRIDLGDEETYECPCCGSIFIEQRLAKLSISDGTMNNSNHELTKDK